MWRGLVIKACTSAVLARELGGAAPETALLASMLTDLGKLLVLSAFMDNEVPVDVEQYKRMCREFARPLGVMLLKRWDVEAVYVDLARQAGDWQLDTGERLQLIDLVNLARYHVLPDHPSLPPLVELPVYRKLPAPHNALDARGRLALVSEQREQVLSLAQSFGG